MHPEEFGVIMLVEVGIFAEMKANSDRSANKTVK
jgi:hypothetical protein